MKIGDWLRDLGFARYAPTFAENAIDADVLSDLTEADLEKLGIPLGDRKRLLKAIRALHRDSPGELITGGGEAQSVRDQSRLTAAERRHLTVMVCDLVGSTAISARLDPEDMCAVIDAYHAACARITLSYEGFVADFRGDGILAYFGYPTAHEDDAERTVRAGLDIIAALAKLETRAVEPLAVRIGIATGLVVVGDRNGKDGLREHALVGDAPNIAARIQVLAEPGMIVLAGTTRRLLGDIFQLRDLGRHEVKGISEPVAAWAVEGVSTFDSRFEAIHMAGLTDFIGRQAELNFLLARQRLAWKGEGQIALVSGEPGIGKSRLAAALGEHVCDEPHTRLRFQCSPQHINSPLRPFITQLERAAQLKVDDSVEQRLDKLEAVLGLGASQLQEVAPLFATLLSIPYGERYPPLALSPAQQRRRIFAALLDQFESCAGRQPVLLIFEDAHWADATSLELLDLTIERLRRLPVLALLTFRPEFEPPWIGLPNVSTLSLGRLDRDNVESIVARVTCGRALPAEVVKQIVAKTDGNPLFVEELTKAVLESGILVERREGNRFEERLPPLAIPATLQDSLMARLDRLAPVRGIAQIAAAIGREFSYPLIRAVVGGAENTLRQALNQLEQAELVFRRGELPEAVYSFKHALLQDAAYESLLKTARQGLHSRIAHALEEKFPDIAGSEPEVVAHHFTEAGLLDRASDYWLKAGNLALSRSANAEAVKHLRTGIELTLAQAPSPERVRKELDFYLALGPATTATEGDAAPETLRVFSHARELLGDGGSLKEQMTVLWGTYLAHNIRAEHVAAGEIARQCLALATRHDHPGALALGNRFMGQTLSFMGAFVDARRHLERTIALCAANPQTITDYRRFGTDDQVMALVFLASALLLLGYPEQSAAATGQALSRARAMGLPYTTANALSHVALLGTIGCDRDVAAAHADELLALSVEHGFTWPEHRARFFQGALLAQSGEPQQGIELMRKAIAADEVNSARNRRTLYLGHLAAAQASVGQPEIGLDLLHEAIQTAETTNERFFEAELHRLRGETLLALGNKAEAEIALNRALAIAAQQQARWWELRAATSLARHWQREGRFADAHAVLQPVCGWFSEGFGMPDLDNAKAFVETLAEQSGVAEPSVNPVAAARPGAHG
jgi:class 3 adenylate cyclase/predicted ATPase